MDAISPWRAAAEWILYHFVGVLIVNGLTLWFFMAKESLEPGIGAITDGGQFAAYSLATGSTTYYLIHRSSALRLKWSSPIGLANIVVIPAAVGLWIFSLLHTAGDDFDIRYVQWPSVALLIFAAMVAFVAVWKDAERSGELSTTADLEKTKKMNIEALKESLARKVRGDENDLAT